MAEFYSITQKRKIVEDIDVGKLNMDLIPIHHMGNYNRDAEIPTCDPLYIKFVADSAPENHTGVFPVQMDAGEMAVADAEYLAQLKINRCAEVDAETDRRVEGGQVEGDTGLFLALPRSSQIYKLAIGMSLLRKALTIQAGGVDPITLLSQPEQDVYYGMVKR